MPPLPLMAVQVVLLTFLLNLLFFRPVGKVVEDREGYISTSRADAKQKLAQVERLEADLAEQLKGALAKLRKPRLSKLSRRSIVFTVRLWHRRKLKPTARRKRAVAELKPSDNPPESQLKGQVDQLSNHDH